ncbi:MAG: YbaB/EbfC family nucleoid-associated protein [Bacteroidota bacterium]
MMKVMGKMKEAQAKMKEATERVGRLTNTADAGGGMITATVTGKRRLQKLVINPAMLADKEMLEDLIVAAVNKALEEIEETSAAEMKKSTEGLLPNIPGMDLSALGL